MKNCLRSCLKVYVRAVQFCDGEKAPSRKFEIEAPDVKGIRERFELSQSEFAALLGVSIKTLQNWEQGRRTPHGAARVLLQVAARHPQAVWEVVEPAILHAY